MTDGERVFLTFRIADGRQVTCSATCIHVWRRADKPQMKMSTSSGPKDMLHNQACQALESSGATAVALMRLVGPQILFLYQRGPGEWCDRNGAVPVIEADTREVVA